MKNFLKKYAQVAEAIDNGQIVGWYQGCSESGNRALGNRHISRSKSRLYTKQPTTM